MTVSQFAVAWEAPSGQLLSPLTEHNSGIRSISIPEGGKELFSSGSAGRAFGWDLSTGQLNDEIQFRPARLPGQPLIRPVVTLSADATRATGARTPVEIFDVETGEDLFCIPPPSSPPAAVNVALSPDGMKVATLSRQADNKRSGSCVVWDLATQQRIAEFDIPGSSAATAPGAAFSPSGNRLVVTTFSRTPAGGLALLMIAYDLKTGKKLTEVEDVATTGGSLNLTLANDSLALAVSSTGRVCIVDFEAGKIGDTINKLPLRAGEAAVLGLNAFSPDGKMFATGLQGDKPETYAVRVYSWPGGKILHTFNGHLGPVTALRFSPDNKFLASGAQDSASYSGI